MIELFSVYWTKMVFPTEEYAHFLKMYSLHCLLKVRFQDVSFPVRIKINKCNIQCETVDLLNHVQHNLEVHDAGRFH